MMYKSRSLYMGKGNSYSTECFQICQGCGAALFSGETEKHNDFHDKIDELIDWAQSVSKLFGKNEPAPEPSLSRHDGNMVGEHEAREPNISYYEREALEIQARQNESD